MNLTDPSTLRALLDRYGLNARKGLGQHFLCSGSAVQAILNCLNGIRGVLEIGPGPGILTGPLTEQVEAVTALEIDSEMAQVLSQTAPSAKIVRKDALAVDLAVLLDELPEPRAVVSNLPYYITAPLVQKIAEARVHYARAVLMMQKEVAERFMAPAGDSDRGSISVYLQALFEIRKVALVPKTAFLPPPKVDSIILSFESRDSLPSPNSEATEAGLGRFFAFVRLGFSQPRKTLANNLGGAYGKARVQAALEERGFSPSIRPHELKLEDWLALSETILS